MYHERFGKGNHNKETCIHLQSHFMIVYEVSNPHWARVRALVVMEANYNNGTYIGRMIMWCVCVFMYCCKAAFRS